MSIVRSPLFALLLSVALASPLLAQTPAQTPGVALGIVVTADRASLGNTAVSAGESVYSGDYLSTDDNGSLQLRMGQLSLQLEASSSMHVYTAPYGAVVELNRGSVIYTTPGGKQNVVIVANDVRVTPDVTQPDLGRVTIENPCEVTVYSQRGQANAQSGKESHVIEQGAAYHVRAENKISYRQYLSPDDSDYHHYHDHEPCAPLYLTHGHLPVAGGSSHFLLVAAGAIGVGTGIGVYKALESPDKP
jgi:hypothetical protein